MVFFVQDSATAGVAAAKTGLDGIFIERNVWEPARVPSSTSAAAEPTDMATGRPAFGLAGLTPTFPVTLLAPAS